MEPRQTLEEGNVDTNLHQTLFIIAASCKMIAVMNRLQKPNMVLVPNYDYCNVYLKSDLLLSGD